MFEAVLFPVPMPTRIKDGRALWCGALFKSGSLYAFILPLRSQRSVKRSLVQYAAGAAILYTRNEYGQFQKKVRAYFSGEQVHFTEKLDLSNISDFSERVLRIVRSIPYGKTWSYSKVAAKAKSPQAMRAVGSVMARNRIPLIIPCHRVLKSNGDIGGFSAGMGTSFKKIMLDIEAGKKSMKNDKNH